MTGPSAASATQNNATQGSTGFSSTNAPAQSTNPAASLVNSATNPRTGAIDTKQLASMVADAAKTDFKAASMAYRQIESELASRNVGDASRFSQDFRSAVAANNNDAGKPVSGPSVTAIGQGVQMAGTQTLVKNPVLEVRWEATKSAWTNKGGLSGPLQDVLRNGGITVVDRVNAPPPGSVGKASGYSTGQANNINGPAAERAIGNRYAAQGYNVTLAPSSVNKVQNGTRVVDVVATKPNADPRLNSRIEVESKVGYTTNSGNVAAEAQKDIARLANNRTIRGAGQFLEGAGKIAKPVGIVLDAIQIGSAYQADGGKIGVNTGRAVSGVAASAAGAWGGASAGAAIGTMIFPGVGTVIGGVVGGVLGGIGGDAAGKGLFDTVRSWF
jgi:hypothetical protein